MFIDETDTFDSTKLLNFLKQYSFDDLAKSFFVLDLWLPNIANPFKIQYLYVLLEAIHNELPVNNKLTDYQAFRNFGSVLIVWC
jgi:hypothetical protein